MRALVDGSCPSCASSLVSSPVIRLARALPSSTPHWSKESIDQIVEAGYQYAQTQLDELRASKTLPELFPAR